jgi:hypothetical protein
MEILDGKLESNGQGHIYELEVRLESMEATNEELRKTNDDLKTTTNELKTATDVLVRDRNVCQP